MQKANTVALEVYLAKPKAHWIAYNLLLKENVHQLTWSCWCYRFVQVGVGPLWPQNKNKSDNIL